MCRAIPTRSTGSQAHFSLSFLYQIQLLESKSQGHKNRPSLYQTLAQRTRICIWRPSTHVARSPTSSSQRLDCGEWFPICQQLLCWFVSYKICKKNSQFFSSLNHVPLGESALGLLRGFVHFVPCAHEQISERLCASKNCTFVNTAEATTLNPRHIYANPAELLEHQELMLFLRLVFS